MNLGQFSTPSPPYLPTISTFHWPVNWAINPSGSPQLSQPSDWDWCTAEWKRMHCVIHCDALCGGRIVSKSSHHKVGTQLGLVEFAAMLWINTVCRKKTFGVEPRVRLWGLDPHRCREPDLNPFKSNVDSSSACVQVDYVLQSPTKNYPQKIKIQKRCFGSHVADHWVCASFDPLLHPHSTVEEKDFVSSNPYDQQQKQFFLSIAKALFSYPRPLQSHLQESIFSTKVMGKRKREEMHHGLSAPVSASCRWDLCISASTNHLRYRLYKVQESSVLLVSTRFERSTWMMLWCSLNL